jgi:hypothetical protein
MLIFFSSCGDFTGTGTPSKSFDYKLQGTWVSNDSSVYSGTLVISYDSITIKGYNEGQTLPALLGGNDNERPFKSFPKGVALKGYSEEGKIFIENGGAVQEGIPYTYQEDKGHNPPAYKIITFNFGGRIETLQFE